MAVLDIGFRNISLRKWSENQSCYCPQNEEMSELKKSGKKVGIKGERGLPAVRGKSGPTPVVRGGSVAKTPLLAACAPVLPGSNTKIPFIAPR